MILILCKDFFENQHRVFPNVKRVKVFRVPNFISRILSRLVSICGWFCQELSWRLTSTSITPCSEVATALIAIPFIFFGNAAFLQQVLPKLARSAAEFHTVNKETRECYKSLFIWQVLAISRFFLQASISDWTHFVSPQNNSERRNEDDSKSPELTNRLDSITLALCHHLS